MKETTHNKLQKKLEKLKEVLAKLTDEVDVIQDILESACEQHNKK